MRIFFSAGEPSGDVHGANLIRALRVRHPQIECLGFGGERMAEAGCRLLYPLCRLAVMWFARVLANAHVFLDLISKADRFFRHHRPDAVVLIDYPGFNWWLARRARFHGIPVFYFVPPQLWAWGGWRVKKMQRFVDHVLCSLPFEKSWYEARGVTAQYVGHPFFDELPEQQLDPAFLDRQTDRGGTIIGLLPGSRTQEVKRNVSTLVRTAQAIHRDRPDTRFLFACFKPAQRELVDHYLEAHPGTPIETFVGRTPEIIELARACVAVSGSVSLELLWREKPSVILYRVGRLDLAVARRFIKSPFISLVNLLAQKEVFPEFLTDHCQAPAIARRVLEWLEDEQEYMAVRDELSRLKEREAESGACRRTAEFILQRVRERLDSRGSQTRLGA
jgi:lipid-A-disaccharide synthase